MIGVGSRRWRSYQIADNGGLGGDVLDIDIDEISIVMAMEKVGHEMLEGVRKGPCWELFGSVLGVIFSRHW